MNMILNESVSLSVKIRFLIILMILSLMMISCCLSLALMKDHFFLVLLERIDDYCFPELNSIQG